MGKAIVEKRVERMGRAAEIDMATSRAKKIAEIPDSATDLKSTLTNQSQNKRL
jgi:hypothetical protein